MAESRTKMRRSFIGRVFIALLAVAALVLGWAILVQYRVQTAGLAQ